MYNHLKYLLEKEYLIETQEYYIINNKQKITLRLDPDLLRYFVNVLKNVVIKVYLYLGQRYSYKPGSYEFTIKEICEHLGLNYNVKCNRDKISDTLSVLSEVGLIKY